MYITHQSVPPLNIFGIYTHTKAEYHSSIDASSIYDDNHPLVLSSLSQVTLQRVCKIDFAILKFRFLKLVTTILP